MTAQGGIDLGGGGGESDGGDSSDGGGGGGGSKKLTVDAFKRYLEDWQERQPDKYEEIRDLLYKEPYTTENYVSPSVWVYYEPKNNKTVYRSDEIEIGAYVQNENPIEIRRALYLYLEVKGPKDEAFKPAKAERQIIQVNEYSENNNSIRIFPDISSLGYMKDEGEVQFRIGISDGTKRDGGWYTTDMPDYPKSGYYGVLDLYVYNNPPAINNSTMSVMPKLIKWDDYTEYRAQLRDKDRDTVNVTLHVYKNDTELNFTKLVPADADEGDVAFSTRDYNIFEEADAGKNFTYRYSCDDGINTIWSEVGYGPSLKRTAEIEIVGKPKMNTKDPKNYWWQGYTFTLDVKSNNPEGGSVTVSLYTYTPENYGKMWPESQTKQVYDDNVTTFTFEDVTPFNVLDRGQTFSYNFTYDMADEKGNYGNGLSEGAEINPKLVKYEVYSGVIMVNMLLLLGFALATGIVLERKFGRGKGG
jgi:hypothetical protein